MITYICDYCGHAIEDDDKNYVAINACGRERFGPDRADLQRTDGYIGHYHADDRKDRNCYRKIRDAIDLAQGAGGTLEQIPVTSNQRVAAMRRKHQRPEA